ncbi:MAG: DUF2384 domain-containing protein [Gemmatimonadales bacterium]|nr:DUF2384 domain-containing protein [Gemmatimonadales bacterium]
MAKSAPGPSRKRIPKRRPDVQAYLEAVEGSRGPNAYVALLGMEAADTASLHDRVEQGIPYRYLEKLHSLMDVQRSALTDALMLSERTIHRRKEAGRLQPDESDRVLRLTRLFGKAIELFEGDDRQAVAWFRKPIRGLGDRSPLEMSRTGPGALEVERLIDRLEHGVPS